MLGHRHHPRHKHSQFDAWFIWSLTTSVTWYWRPQWFVRNLAVCGGLIAECARSWQWLGRGQSCCAWENGAAKNRNLIPHEKHPCNNKLEFCCTNKWQLGKMERSCHLLCRRWSQALSLLVKGLVFHLGEWCHGAMPHLSLKMLRMPWEKASLQPMQWSIPWF